MTVAVGSGSGWQVAGQSAEGSSPQIDATDTSLQVRSPERSGPFWVLGRRDSWGITLPQVPTLDVRLQLNAGIGRASTLAARRSETWTSPSTPARRRST